MKREIGILGLGSMGTAIALNLKKKYKIFGYDINKHNKIKSSKNFIFVKKLKEIFLKTNIFVIIVLNENQCQKIFNKFIEIKKNLKITKNYTIINCTTVSPNWVKKIQQLTNGKKDKRLNVDWIDVGNVEKWGYPITYSKRNCFFNYANNFYKKNNSPDLVLIDGRLRVFCFLAHYGSVNDLPNNL